MAALVRDGLATATTRRMLAGKTPIEVEVADRFEQRDVTMMP